MKNAKIAICIVDYGDPSYIEKCLASIEEGVAYVRENGVGDEFYCETFIHDARKKNLGFTQGNNTLIKLIQKNDFFNWVWLLNNDTTVPKETLLAIARMTTAGGDEGVGVFGFKILSMDDPDLIHHAGTGACFPGGVHKSGSVKLKQFTEKTLERWVTFASVLIRREVFEDVGILDGKMYNFFSDSDFCYRARYGGWKVMYEPSFVIYHKIGQSQRPDPKNQRIMGQDALAFQAKWINGKAFFDLDKEAL